MSDGKIICFYLGHVQVRLYETHEVNSHKLEPRGILISSEYHKIIKSDYPEYQSELIKVLIA